MIHYRENCNCKTFHELTNICTECAWHNHYAFIQHHKNGTESSNPTEQKVLLRLKSESDSPLRIGTKRHKLCGHPGIWQGTKCAICAEIKRSQSGINSGRQVDVLKSAIVEMGKNITEMEQKKETLQNLLKLAEMGMPVGEVSAYLKGDSPRQRAIQEGKKWYMPYDPCKHCGVIAERYVPNGRCRNCGQ